MKRKVLELDHCHRMSDKFVRDAMIAAWEGYNESMEQVEPRERFINLIDYHLLNADGITYFDSNRNKAVELADGFLSLKKSNIKDENLKKRNRID